MDRRWLIGLLCHIPAQLSVVLLQVRHLSLATFVCRLLKREAIIYRFYLLRELSVHFAFDPRFDALVNILGFIFRLLAYGLDARAQIPAELGCLFALAVQRP